MADIVDSKRRSEIMSSIRSKDSAPELLVRSIVHRLGYRYSLHRRDLPGTPDLVFRRRRRVIFVHGCFWHCHEGCKKSSLPKSNADFWRRKLERNQRQDNCAVNALTAKGWTVLVVWQCELKDLYKVEDKIKAFFG
jgi:DNA mismatch endonuclease (patch repair protein)